MIEAMLRDMCNNYLITRRLNVDWLISAESVMPPGLWEIVRTDGVVVRQNHVFSSAFCTWTSFLQDTEHCYILRLCVDSMAVKQYNMIKLEHERL